MLLKVTVCLFSRTCCLVICIQAGSWAGMEQSTQCSGQVYFCLCRFMVFSMTLAWYVENERYTGLEPGPDLYALFCGFKEGCVGHLDLPGCVPLMYNPSNQPRY